MEGRAVEGRAAERRAEEGQAAEGRAAKGRATEGWLVGRVVVMAGAEGMWVKRPRRGERGFGELVARVRKGLAVGEVAASEGVRVGGGKGQPQRPSKCGEAEKKGSERLRRGQGLVSGQRLAGGDRREEAATLQ